MDSLDLDNLSSLHNPKSLHNFKNVFKDESNFYKLLDTNPTTGINNINSHDYKLSKRFIKFGNNKLPDHVPKTFCTLIIEAFEDKTMILLTISAIVSFLLGMYELFYQPDQYDPEGNKISKVDWIEGVAIMFAVLVVVFVGAINDYQKELQFIKLNEKKTNRKIIVIRNNNECLISIYNLLVGDVISLQTGDIIPADCVLINGTVEADESSITGESDQIKKLKLSICLSNFDSDQDCDIGDTNPQTNRKIHDCMLISGSRILSGLGKAVVTAVGENSINGKILTSLNNSDDATPLQERLSELTDSISVFGIIAAVILFIVLLLKFFYYVLTDNGIFHDLPNPQKINKLVNILITAITIIVVAVPEGLPLAVTLALAFATTRMTKDGNLVRVLKACETMGSATTICSDKTGTLTENIMTVIKGELMNSKFDDSKTTHRYSNDNDSTTDNSNSSNDSLDKPTSFDIFNKSKNKEFKQCFFTNVVLNSTAFENKDYLNIDDSNPFSMDLQRRRTSIEISDEDLLKQINKKREEAYIGSKTETALLNLARRSMGLQWGQIQYLRDNLRESFDVVNIVQIIPFESSRKWSGIVVKYDNFYRLYVKGAAEIISNNCKFKSMEGNVLTKIDDKILDDINGSINHLANQALRAIILGHRDFKNCIEWPPAELVDSDENDKANNLNNSSSDFDTDTNNDSNSNINYLKEASPDFLLKKVLSNDEDNNTGLVLDGLIGIQDPLRPGVKDSVLQCQKAGVVVRLVTGDNLLTAKAIAKNCNILNDESFNEADCAMEGPSFRDLSNEERIKIIPNLRVLARSSPEDKRLLVFHLKQMNKVVAVTGDGTNDAPALKLADVGFSMGIAGTEVAREASDIILMTDDFSAIVNAIKWGRCVAISIKKFIQFQLIVNITAVILTFITAVLSEDESSVLTAVQLLWVNLIMDTLAALALATDKPDKNILDKKPRGRDAPLITISTWKMILGQSLLQLIITFSLHFHGKSIFFKNFDKITGHQQQQLNAMTFNTFVWLQFFTLLVSRKLDEGDDLTNWRDRINKDNLNFFQDLNRNYYFLAILFIIGFCQVLIMLFGGEAFSIAKQTKFMWVVSICCGLLSLPMGIIIRICPDQWFLSIFSNKFMDKVKYLIGLDFIYNRLSNGDGNENDEEALLDSRSSI